VIVFFWCKFNCALQEFDEDYDKWTRDDGLATDF